MGKRKKQNLRIKGYQTEESAAIKKFIILTLIVIVFVVAMYFVTKMVTKDDSEKESAIKYSYVTAGTMFNRSDSEYYVFAYNSADNNKADYESIVTNYGYTGNEVSLYVADTSDYLNKDYVGENSNPEATGLEDLKLGDITLLKIKDGKIVKYLEDINKIKTELGIN